MRLVQVVVALHNYSTVSLMSSRLPSDIEAKRQAECKLRSDLMEDELLQWRKEVDAYQRHSINKAEETAQVRPCMCIYLHQIV